MNKLSLKIALRTFLKGKWYNFLNISGLALGLAAFIFVALYVDNETSYDQWNANIDRIFLVEIETPNGPSPYTPGKLATAIKNQCPEVEEAGRMNTALFQLPFYTPSGRFLIKKWVGADYSIAKILGVKPEGFRLDSGNAEPAVLLSKQTASVLFPDESDIKNKTVNMVSKTGMPMTIAGVAECFPGNTNLSFDCIAFSNDITQGKDQSYTNRIYQTYLLVRPDADIDLLSKKIDKIYKQAVLEDSSLVAKEALTLSDEQTIFLDPLKNLHLKPHYASHVNYQIVKGLVILAIIVLVVSGVNFTSLYVSQSNRRSKEVGIKKVNGSSKRQIAVQFLTEIFFQCLLALILSFIIVIIGLPYFNQLLDVNLLISGISLKIIIQLSIALLLLTMIAGVYPAMVMAEFKSIEVLRGNLLTNGEKFSWLRGSITVFQFTFAIGFVITLVVIYQQVTFMKSEDPGFNARQVVYIDNLGIYNDPDKFKAVSDRIKAIPGVKNVAVSSNIPGGIPPVSREYVIRNRAYAMQTIAVGYEYFETLNIKLKEGQVFSSSFPIDSANAVINETAAKIMGLKDPVGTTVQGPNVNYRIIGVIKDVKANGFEASIQPVIYLMNDGYNHLMNPGYGLSKTHIMISAESKAIPAMLSTLRHQWSEINKLDGDNFSYHFLDELYGQLFRKQEQLQYVLTSFSITAVFIASLGFFASAAQTIRFRMKEIAIRKVYGARNEQLMFTLAKPFFYNVFISNLIAWPASFIIATKWLETFAYRTHISVTPFIIATLVSVVVVAVTVCLQLIRAVRVNPAVKLKV